MRALPILTAALLLSLAVASPPAAALPIIIRFVDDGLTARITFPGSTADVLLHPDANGAVAVELALFRHEPTGWQQVSMGASLRVFRSGLPEVDVYSQYFVSSATAPTTLVVPAPVFTTGFHDVFVTFSSVGGSPVPTSHHNIVKNALIGLGQFSLAEGLDYNLPTRPLVLV